MQISPGNTYMLTCLRIKSRAVLKSACNFLMLGCLKLTFNNALIIQSYSNNKLSIAFLLYWLPSTSSQLNLFTCQKILYCTLFLIPALLLYLVSKMIQFKGFC